MQRWWPSGQPAGPCGEQGRQAESGVLRSPHRRGPSGPKPNAGTVGPKIATTGVPDAAARCSGAESLVTSTAARSMSAADARSDSCPGRVEHASRGRGGDLGGERRDRPARR